MALRTYKGLSVRDLRLSRLNKKIKLQPCAKEITEYLSALGMTDGTEDKIPKAIAKALTDCQNEAANSARSINLNSMLMKHTYIAKK